jgi:hypothetical protein
MDLTNEVTLIQICVSAQVQAECNAGCQWRHGKEPTNTTKPEENQGYCLWTPSTVAIAGRRLESTEYAVAFDATNPDAKDTYTKPAADDFSTATAEVVTTTADKFTTTAAGVTTTGANPCEMMNE